MLKVFVLLALFSAVHCGMKFQDYSDSLKAIAKQVHFQCQTFSGASEEEINRAREGDFTGSEALKRFMACIWLLTGIVDENLQTNAAVLEKMEPEIFRGKGVEIYSKCANKGKSSGGNIVDKVWVATLCVYEIQAE
ncbi:unnamed protein product, partial [Phyllotreta striolata]